MYISSSKKAIIESNVLFAMVIFFCLSMPFVFETYDWTMTISLISLVVLIGIVAFIHWLVIGKKLNISSDGCTVSFFRYRRFYRWDEFSIIRLENLRNAYSFGSKFKPCYEEYVFLSICPVKKPSWMYPNEYCMFHPLNCFFVCFCDLHLPDAESSALYVADKEEFLGKLKEWGVSLTK